MKVITLHGLKAKKKWFRALETCKEFKQNKIDFLHFEYGLFNSLFRREKIYNLFSSFYAENIKENECPSAICHSFGTLILLKAFMKFSEIRFDKVILFGSIWNRQTDLSMLFKDDRIGELLHEVGHKDQVARYSRLFFGKDAGNSGQKGFEFIPAKYADRIQQPQYNNFKHSDATFILHIKKTWIPFLTKQKFQFRRDILSDSVLEWIYLLEPNEGIRYTRAIFCARIDEISKSRDGSRSQLTSVPQPNLHLSPGTT